MNTVSELVTGLPMKAVKSNVSPKLTQSIQLQFMSAPKPMQKPDVRQQRLDKKQQMAAQLEAEGWTQELDKPSKVTGWVSPRGEGFMSLDGAYNVVTGLGEVCDLRAFYRQQAGV